MDTILQGLAITCLAALLGAPFALGINTNNPQKVRHLIERIKLNLGLACFGWVMFCIGGFAAPLLSGEDMGSPFLILETLWAAVLPAALLYIYLLKVFSDQILDN
ncbi:hypothetical protein [Epibacterium sp. Ofav1-8]|uniref:hypothetical protein n=1 Tax=Epibacterium sp. Ofav1-8 TaxID=2917735 RepID=UPI001EF5A288|nr:hypothetical protein [Epibacterium sp. Ofav1-8]MCG7625564.1 hypothetical protein [Epibacterium sp. Ofav1-8]